MLEFEPGPFTDEPRHELPPPGERETFGDLAAQLAVDFAPHRAALDAAHGALASQATIDVDGALDGTHGELVTAAIEIAEPIPLDDLNVAAAGFADLGVDVLNLAQALPPEARTGPPPPFTPPPESEPSEPPSPVEPPLV